MWTSRLRDLLARWRAKAAIDTRQNADVRRSLVESLYASPASLAVGAIAGSAVSVAVARVAHDGLVTIIAIFICIIALSRIISAYYFDRSEEHTSELQSLMRISYAVFCLKKKNN